MGIEVCFSHRLPPEAIGGSFLFDEEEDEDLLVEYFGHVHFSGFTQNGQKKAYGIDFVDCLTFGPAHEDTSLELIGDPDVPGIEGWYTPDWDRALARLERLLTAWQATTNEHRKEYDAGCLPKFAELVRRCANHRDRANCKVKIT